MKNKTTDLKLDGKDIFIVRCAVCGKEFNAFQKAYHKTYDPRCRRRFLFAVMSVKKNGKINIL